MPVRRGPPTFLLSLLVGCGLFSESTAPETACRRDQDCRSPQRCFVDGCGILPDDLLAEVTTSVPSGVTSVDLPVGPARADLPLVLPDAQRAQLSIRRGAVPYPAGVKIVASGKSALLPGVNRTTQVSGSAASGVIRVDLSTGRYTVVVSPLDPGVPPAVRTAIGVDAGVTTLTVDLLETARVQTFAGTVLAGPGQPEPVPPGVQLLGPDGRQLSARRTADPSGAFQLSAGVGALDGGAFLQVTPGPGALGAVIAFDVSDAGRFDQPFIVGDTPPPIRVSGTLVGPDGSPVAGASIFVQGKVVGGGSGNVGPALSADDGSFSILTLAQAAPGTLELWAIPPAGSAAGLLRTALEAPPGAPVTGRWTCPARPLLAGALLLPDAGPRVGARVRADPIAAVALDLPLPPAGASAVTGETGLFAIRLDPAVYQLEVEGTADAPALRQFARLTTAGLQLGTIVLPSGRRLTARVLRESGTSVAQALVRVYRQVTLEDGTPRALLLGEGVSNESGLVTILLPAP